MTALFSPRMSLLLRLLKTSLLPIHQRAMHFWLTPRRELRRYRMLLT